MLWQLMISECLMFTLTRGYLTLYHNQVMQSCGPHTVAMQICSHARMQRAGSHSSNMHRNVELLTGKLSVIS